MLVVHIIFAVASLVLHGAFAFQSVRGADSKTLRNATLFIAAGTVLSGVVLSLNGPAPHAIGAFVFFLGIHGVIATARSRRQAELQ